MADEKKSVTERIASAANSPTGKRVMDDVMYMTGGRTVADLADKVSKRGKNARSPKARDRGRR